ncbi:MAG: hypothetical protein IT422_10370 [Pirellulaceae bacterium]|nr:hypothetical protein [Pirellulaceae bacterium]
MEETSRAHVGWLILSYLGLGSLLGLCFHDVWYGIGWGVIGGPLMLIGLIAGYGASIITMIYGSWDQRLIVALPFLQYTAIFISPLF